MCLAAVSAYGRQVVGCQSSVAGLDDPEGTEAVDGVSPCRSRACNKSLWLRTLPRKSAQSPHSKERWVCEKLNGARRKDWCC